MNHFYKLWTDANNNQNEYSPLRVYWQDVPGRDNEWKRKTISDIGSQRFDVEFDCKFAGSAGTLINSYTLQNMIFIEPVEIRYDNKFRIYEYPKEGRKYIVISDVAEGLGQDFSTCQVIDVTDEIYKQVAVYEDDEVKTNIFPTVIEKIGKYYNDAIVIVENNSIGDGVLNDLHYDLEYENLFFDDKFGIRMTKLSKSIGNSYLKTFIEDNLLQIVDENTVDQFNTYIKRGNTYKAEENKHDDLITPLVLFAYFMNNKKWIDDWLDLSANNNDLFEKRKNKIEEELLPMGFFNDGEEEINLDGDVEDF